MTKEQKDQMFAWVCEVAGDADKQPWWEHCSDPVAARAFVAEHLPHLLAPSAEPARNIASALAGGDAVLAAAFIGA